MSDSQTESRLDVLIVGLGPVGAVLAGLLAQWNVSVLAIDRETEIYRLPRAAHFDHEIMRIFQQLGIVDEIQSDIRPLSVYEFRNAVGEILMRFDNAGQRTVSGWPPSYMFHQPAVELALRRRLAGYSHVEVRTGTRLMDILTNNESGICALLEDPNGHQGRVFARFLIGADGGASTVRRLIGVKLSDYGFEEPWLVIDAVCNDETGLPPYGLQICDPARPTTVMPMGPGRRRWEFMLLPGEEPEEMLEDEKIAALLERQAQPGQVEVVRKAVYEFHGLVAERWRRGSVLLAGDAAHQMPPFLGQGMCSGIRDAANLSWKLALTIKDRIDAGLLDTYQIEREPHVRDIIERAIEMGRVICTVDPEVAKNRDAAMLRSRQSGRSDPLPRLPGIKQGFVTATPLAGELFLQPQARLRNGSKGRLDDLLGLEFWLISKTPVDSISMEHMTSLHLGRDLLDDGTIADWLEKAKADAVLVRPDRYVFGTGKAIDLVNELRLRLGT